MYDLCGLRIFGPYLVPHKCEDGKVDKTDIATHLQPSIILSEIEPILD